MSAYSRVTSKELKSSIPDGWEITHLESLAHLKSGQSITSSSIDDSAPFACLGGNGIRGFARTYTHEGVHALIGRQGALCGNICIAEGQFFASEHAIVVTPREGTDIFWLASVLQRMDLNQFSESSAQPGLSVKKLLPVPILRPGELAEQERISATLTDIDDLIASLDALIAKKRDIKQAAMQQLLTGKTRLPGFDGLWVKKRLASLGIFLKGSGVRRDQARSGDIPCVRYGEIYTDHDDVVRQFRSFISAEVAEQATPLQGGDLLFAGSGETKEEIGKCVAFVSEHQAFAGGDIIILRPHWGNSVFLGYLMNATHIARQKANRGQGDAVVHISARALGAISAPMPEPAEQAAIAEVLTAMDEEIEALHAKKAKTAGLKDGMMQQLLTGRIRLA